MGSSIYKAIEVLQARKMIAIETIREKKYVIINFYPDTWETKDKEILIEIVSKGIRILWGENGNELEDEEEQILNSLKKISNDSSDAKYDCADDDVKTFSNESDRHWEKGAKKWKKTEKNNMMKKHWCLIRQLWISGAAIRVSNISTFWSLYWCHQHSIGPVGNQTKIGFWSSNGRCEFFKIHGQWTRRHWI